MNAQPLSSLGNRLITTVRSRKVSLPRARSLRTLPITMLVFACLSAGTFLWRAGAERAYTRESGENAAGRASAGGQRPYARWATAKGLLSFDKGGNSVKAAFAPGNLVIYRVGDGAAALTSAATAVFLDEYTSAGALVQSIALPTTPAGSNRALTAAGTATSEGLLTRSVDGRYLVLPGYDAALGTAAVAGTTSAAISRVIGRVNFAGSIDTTTALTDAISAGNPRGATSTNGVDLWLSGTSAGGGIRYATLGATTSTSLSATPTNLRATNIFNGQLYVSSNTGAFRLSTVGTGTPTTSGQTITNLPGYPTATTSPYAFFFADLNAGVAGVDTVYVADDSSVAGGGGIQKYSLVGGLWTANGTIGLASTRGITGVVNGTNVTLYVTNAGAGTNTLQTLTDTSGYNATITGTLTSLATAPTNTAFRGVALAPLAPTITVSGGALNFGNVMVGTSSELTYTVSGSGLTDDITITSGSSEFLISTTSGSGFVSSLNLPQSGGTVASTTIYVRFTPTSPGVKNTNLTHTSTNATTQIKAVSGTGVTPEIDIRGDGVSIADGDVTPDVADDTDFGDQDVNGGGINHVFTIENTGTANLILGGTPKVQITGPNASDFTVTLQPATTVVPAGTTTFAISFDPSAVGVRTATVSILNNDSDEGTYDFAIQGNSVVPFELVVNTTSDTDDGLCDSTHCSLREAINMANLDTDSNVISFDIPLSDPGQFAYEDNGGAGVSAANITSTSTLVTIDPHWPQSWWRITPGTALPQITTELTIDGYSQRPCEDDPTLPCSQENTEPTGNNAILLIELDGSDVELEVLADGKRKATQAVGDGLVVTDTGASSTIMGLVINNWAGNGIVLQGGFDGGDNIVRGNFIGTDVSGTLAADFSFGNSVGLRIESFGNQVGCEVAQERNIISGNVNDGVQIVGAEALLNFIQGNFIGTGRDGSVIGNGAAGVAITDSSTNLIGAFPFSPFANRQLEKFRKSAGGCAGCCRRNSGSAAKADPVEAPPGNVIAGNAGDGVAVESVTEEVEALDNIISQNSIFDNGGLGIDLGNDGITANDNCDEDEGPNHLQNFPVVTSAFTDGLSTTIQFTLDSTVDETVDETFIIEFFTNTSADPSGNGEGRTFIDSTTVTLSELECSEDFTFPVGALTPGLFVTATATDSGGNTSEFGPNRMVTSPTAANGTVSGAILDDQGVGVAGVVISLSGTQNRKTITNAKGAYFFDAVEANGFYTVTPERANYSFSPALRSFNQLGNHTEAGFNASRGAESTNPLDTAEFFVRQQYVDILGREPDEGGFNYWSNEINRCGSDAPCVNARRRDIAAAFFIEQEFQQSGSYIYNLYSGGLGRKPVYAEYAMDRRQVVGGATLETQKASFALNFVQRADFVTKYQTRVTAESFVDALLQTVRQSSGVDLSGQRASLVGAYGNGDSLAKSRSLVLQRVTDNAAFKQAEYNAAFVLTEYFGYLKRDPEQGGFDFWLNVLNNREPGNFRGMVCSFITSTEYQKRFSSVVTHSNAECGR